MKEFIRNVKELAQSDKTGFILFKEFDSGFVEDYRDTFEECGFLVGSSYPNNELYIDKWDSYDSYLGAMKKKYRYTIKTSMKKLDTPDVSVVYNENFSGVFTDENYNLYTNVLEKSDTVFEVLSKQYFQGINQVSDVKPCLISIYLKEKLIGYLLAADLSPAELGVLFVGIDYGHRHEYDTYFNLAYESIKLAFLRKKSKLSFGQKANDFKSRLGCVTEGLYLVYTNRNRLINRVMKLLGKYIVPRKKSGVRAIFKSG
jgi:predicted N-acyltransferase